MIPIETQLIQIRKWPLYIMAAVFFLFVFIVFDKPEHGSAKNYSIVGGLILFTLFYFFLSRTKIILDNEGITVSHIFIKSINVKWNEIKASDISWQIEGHTANIYWTIISDNNKKITLQPSFYSRKNLLLIAEILIEKSPAARIDNRIRKIADGKFPWYLF
jgi:hypothetical protein